MSPYEAPETKTERDSDVVSVTFGPPKFPAEVMRGSAFHREALKIAFSGRSGADRWIRSWRFDKFHRRKLGFIMRQKHVLSRVRNYLRFRREALRASDVRFIPPEIKLETGKNCLLGCPGCGIGLQNANEGVRFRYPFASLETMKAIIDQTYERAIQLSLHTHGEPLLNKHFFDACRYGFSKGLWTIIHTSLMPKVPDLARKLIDAGLCNLVASIDGATQQTYEKYRRGGEVDRAFANIRELADLKRARRRSLPWITAKFHVFEHNWHEIKDFRERALAAGADEAVFVAGFSNGVYATGRGGTEFEFNLDTLAWETRVMPVQCPFLWTEMRFDDSGGVTPCCNGGRPEDVFSEFEDADGVSRYNSAKHRRMRRFFLGATEEGAEGFPRPCRTCELVRSFPGP